MNAMLTIFLALLAGTFGGTVAGGLAGWWLGKRRVSCVPLNHDAIDPDVDHQINEAAHRWANCSRSDRSYATDRTQAAVGLCLAATAGA
jgi:hypothetical protein